MASTNQSPEYQKAEVKFLSAQTKEEKLTHLEEMIRECPKHKSAEKMLAQLRTRYKKLKEEVSKSKKSSSKKQGIKKEDMQAAIVGYTNVGKSSLLSEITNTKPEIANYEFTTKKPVIGMMDYDDIKIQLIEIPAFGSEYYDKGIVNSADTLVIIIENLNQLKEIQGALEKNKAKKIIVMNKTERLNSEEKRKITSTLQSKKLNFVLISLKEKEGLYELKNKIFLSFDKIRVYTKPDILNSKKSEKPIILPPETPVEIVAKKTVRDISKIKETKIWGPSSKFPGQKVGLKHKLKDLDIVEFKTR